MNRTFIAALLASALVYSCDKDTLPHTSGSVTLELTGSGMEPTKSDQDEHSVRTVQVFICAKGEILHSSYFSGSSEMVMDVEYSSEQEYTFFTLVNLPEITSAEGESLDEVLLHASSANAFSYGGHCSGNLIMTGTVSRKVEGNCIVEVPVHRLIDKVHITNIRNLTGIDLTLERMFIQGCPGHMRWNPSGFTADPAEMLNISGRSADRWAELYRNAVKENDEGLPVTDYWSSDFSDFPHMLGETLNSSDIGNGEIRFAGTSLYPIPYIGQDGICSSRLVLEVTCPDGLPGWYCINLSFPKQWNCELLIQELILQSRPAADPSGETRYVLHGTSCDIGDWEKLEDVTIAI